MPGDSSDRGLDVFLGALARSLRGRSRAPVTATQADPARQFSTERVDLFLHLGRTLDLSEHELPTVQRMVAASVWDEEAQDEETQDSVDAYASDPPTSNDGDERLRRERAELIASVREMAPTIDPAVFEALAGLLDAPGSLAMDDAITVTY